MPQTTSAPSSSPRAIVALPARASNRSRLARAMGSGPARTLAGVAWALVVLGAFAWSRAPWILGFAATLKTLALGVVVVEALWLTGYRISARAPALVPPAASGLERSLVEVGLGAGAACILVTLGGFLGLLSPLWGWVLLAALLVGPHGALLEEARGRARCATGGPSDRWAAASLVLAALLTLPFALAPVVAQDALVYHLALPARYIQAGRIDYVPESFFAQFPQYLEMLYAWGLLLGGESLAQSLHWVLGALATGAVGALAGAVDPRSRRLLAAALFATMPTVLLLAGWAYIDLGVLFFITLSLVALARRLRHGGRGPLLLAALFAGLAAGCKYTAGFQGLVVVAGAFVATTGGSRRRPLVDAALAASVVGLVASPWWIKNLLWTGNPLQPFCYSIFGGADWDTQRAHVLSLALSQWGGGLDPGQLLLLPWRLTMSADFFSEERFDGIIGCAFLLGAPLLVRAARAGSRLHRTMLVLALAYAAFWVVTTQQIRFLLPALVLLAATLGASFELLASATSRRLWIGGFRAAMAVNLFIASLNFAAHNPLPTVLGLESRDAYLARELPGGDYAVLEFIEKRLPEDSYILCGSLGNPGFRIRRRYHADAFFENWTLAAILEKANSPAEALQELRSRGFTHILLRFDCVFDPTRTKSDLPLEDQTELMELLNTYGRLLTQANGTCLYALDKLYALPAASPADAASGSAPPSDALPGDAPPRGAAGD